jgi:hypothetical protein
MHIAAALEKIKENIEQVIPRPERNDTMPEGAKNGSLIWISDKASKA